VSSLSTTPGVRSVDTHDASGTLTGVGKVERWYGADQVRQRDLPTCRAARLHELDPNGRPPMFHPARMAPARSA
jgi:hypothetical protein